MCESISLLAMTTILSAIVGALFHSVARIASPGVVGSASLVGYLLSTGVLTASGFGFCVLVWQSAGGCL